MQQSAGSDTWVVYGESYSLAFSGYSHPNFTIPSHIRIGEELYGVNTGASAQNADFTYNEWLGSGGWNYQKAYNPNNNDFDNPPYGFWVNGWTPNNDYHGGDLETYCC